MICRLFKMVNGEFVISNVKDSGDGKYVLDYPASIIPIPPEQANGINGQIGFGKFAPFSDNKKGIEIYEVIMESHPDEKMKKAYNDWVKTIKEKESGIILATSNPPLNNIKNNKIDFSKLNI